MDKCFALYRFPYDNRCTLMQSDSSEPEILFSYSEFNGKTGFVFAPFEISDKYPLLIIKPDFVKTFDIGKIPDYAISSLIQTDREDEKKQYGKDFNIFHSCLSNGRFIKIVLSRCSEEKTSGTEDYMELFRRACWLYPRMFISLVSSPRCGTWLMATPELLLEGCNDKWHTMALAGTMSFDDERKLAELPDNNLISEISDCWDKKNVKEQQYVSQYINEILINFADNIEETAPRTVRAGNLFHLASDFRFTLKSDKLFGDLIKELHPTPAVCGIPKQETYKFISENESHERGYYSGFAGPLNHNGSTHLFVTLRCMRIGTGKCRLYAGGGLLKDSDGQSEWMETEAKMETMRRCLAIKRI